MPRILFAFLLAATTAAQTNWYARPSSGLLGRSNSAVVYDSAHGYVLLFGGLSGSGRMSDTWTYNGLTWQQLPGVGGPTFFPAPSYDTLAAAFDSARGVTVLTNGWDFSTWEFNGTTWRLADTMAALGGRFEYALAYDSVRHVVVLFGGTYQNNNFGYSDTWEWNGTNWTQVAAGGPHIRFGHAMAFDEQRGVTVLFGGQSNTGFSGNNIILFGDTWEWNGTGWLEHFGVTGPSPRTGAAMTYDTHRQRTVLFGGQDNVNNRNDLWEWNGTSWSQVATLQAPPADFNRPLVYDSGRRVAVLYATQSTTDVWELLSQAPVAATFTPFGQGCAGPVGTPALSAGPGSLPRIGTTFVARLDNLPASPLNVPIGVLGYDATAWNGSPLPLSLDPLGFTGCQAWIAPSLSVSLVNANGSANWNIGVPFAVPLVGVNFYLQGGVLAPGWNPGGMVFSNAGHGVIGTP
jgi:hypothetical protein